MPPDADRLPPPSADLPDVGLDDFIDQLRAQDPAFAEASVLYPDDMGEWQAAVYLLAGCDPVWRVLGAAVMAERSTAPVISEIENPRRGWSASEDEVLAWAAHFWELRRNRANFLSTFQGPLFDRWIIALHLRQRRALTARLMRAAVADELSPGGRVGAPPVEAPKSGC
jgi:hypothetical protein